MFDHALSKFPFWTDLFQGSNFGFRNVTSIAHPTNRPIDVPFARLATRDFLKVQEILGNSRKFLEILGNSKEILGNSIKKC